MRISIDGSKLVINKEEQSFEDVVVYCLLLSYILRLANGAIRYFIPNTYKIDTLIIYGVLAGLVFEYINVIIKRVSKKQLIFIVCESLLILTAGLFYSWTNIHTQIGKTFLLTCIPSFLLIGCTRDYRKVYEKLTTAMTIIPYLYLLEYLLFGLGALASGESYNQSDAYVMLFPATVLACALLKKITLKYLVPFGISMFFMIAYGARGPLACVVLFIIFACLLNIHQKSVKKRLLAVTPIVISTIPIFMFFGKIVLWIKDLIEKLGFSVRILDSLIKGNFLTDRSRNIIAKVCFDRIKDNPLWGMGPINDRIYITDVLYSGQNAFGNYPHSFFIEVLLQYGTLLGAVLLIWFFVILIRAMKKHTDGYSQRLLTIFVGAFFFPLLFSKSYLDYANFYVLLGLCFSINFGWRHKMRQGEITEYEHNNSEDKK